ncbi:glutamine amidotransferase [Aureimonas sp. AU22]|uniref:glutamine amidotransferase n=1 Tax=Aureimonas sp. AU22 TaxID=1638162 RepID=UPI001FCDC2C9|nr:glutamine amidotransferase [Aureimonas sp. AU22]
MAKHGVMPLADAIRLLFAGESWVTRSLHIKGFDSFEMSSYHEGGTEMIAALRNGGVEVTYQPSHIAANAFPTTAEELGAFDVVVLSDIGANTLLLPERTAVRSEPTANRLELIADFVRGGGGLLMVGGYLTFQGIQAKGNYFQSPVDEVLPVALQASDDRSEQPQGIHPRIHDAAHPIVAGLGEWPHFLGYNKSTLRPDARLVASFGDHPFIATREVGGGRSAVFASDCGPHWGPPAFVSWEGYPKLWVNIATWLAGR